GGAAAGFDIQEVQAGTLGTLVGGQITADQTPKDAVGGPGNCPVVGEGPPSEAGARTELSGARHLESREVRIETVGKRQCVRQLQSPRINLLARGKIEVLHALVEVPPGAVVFISQP